MTGILESMWRCSIKIRRRGGRLFLVTVLCSLGILVVGCGAAPDRRSLTSVYRLDTNLHLATIQSETAEIEFGEVEYGGYLEAGWSYRQFDHKRGRSYRWGVGEESTLSLFVLEPRDLTITLEGYPHPQIVKRGQRVTLVVNDFEVGSFELSPRLGRYDVLVSAQYLQAGKNRLGLRYSRALGATDRLGSAELRPLAVAWYRLGTDSLTSTTVSLAPKADHGELFIPFGTQVEFFLKVPPKGILTVAESRHHGKIGGEVTVFIQSDGDIERPIEPLRFQDRLTFSLEDYVGQPVRLALRAVGDTSHQGGSGFTLREPTIWGSESRRVPPAATRVGGNRPNIVLYLIDTLRSDHLGCYGYDRPVSPAIDEFASAATLFENSRAQSSWTRASVASIFTGVWPNTHGAVRGGDRLSAEALTMAEILSSAGYQTVGLSGSPNASAAFGMDQGFDLFELINRTSNESQALNQRAFEWLETRDRSMPFFLFVHTIDPHHPYLAPDPFLEKYSSKRASVYQQVVMNPAQERWPADDAIIGELLNLYDAEIASNDLNFGKLMDELRRLDLFESSLVVLTADHGEEFYDHRGWNHGANLYRETLNVPLIIKYPHQREAMRVKTLVQHSDILPTVLDLSAIDVPRVEGKSLAPLMASSGADIGFRAEPLFFHLRRGPLYLGIIEGNWKLIQRRDKGRIQSYLFDWKRDPEEQTNLSRERPIHTAVLSALLDDRLYRQEQQGRLAPEEAEIDDELRESLRALGYLD